MIRQGLNGFLMALADSVPGVSGGTVAFIMGFYDNFIGAIDDLMPLETLDVQVLFAIHFVLNE